MNNNTPIPPQSTQHRTIAIRFEKIKLWTTTTFGMKQKLYCCCFCGSWLWLCIEECMNEWSWSNNLHKYMKRMKIFGEFNSNVSCVSHCGLQIYDNRTMACVNSTCYECGRCNNNVCYSVVIQLLKHSAASLFISPGNSLQSLFSSSLWLTIRTTWPIQFHHDDICLLPEDTHFVHKIR